MNNLTFVHIHAPKATAKRTFTCICPDCKQKTKLLQFFTPWYGWNSTCIKCGREWSDGEWMRLPFAKGARQRNIELAKLMWKKMPPISKNHYGDY